MNSGRRNFLKVACGAFAAAGVGSAIRGASNAGPRRIHRSDAVAGYKCIFNHELLIVVGKEGNSPEYIASFIEKLRDTDVDAVMCCPTAWRTNLFPSRVDPLERNHRPGQPSPKFTGFARIMDYIHRGGDPVRETLAACRAAGKAFFISYRMNDHHYVDDKEWPTHNAIWRENPGYWFGDSNDSPRSASDNIRLFNYMVPEVRDYYFAIIQELCTDYDVDGVELDFQRFPRFFRSEDLEKGRGVMTAFVRRIKDMMIGLGRARGKLLPLCIRIPETLVKCHRAGLDVAEWDRAGLVEMINLSSHYIHTIELGVEEFRAAINYGRLYGEMNYVTFQGPRLARGFDRRYTTFEIYRASALNLFHRGVDGLSLFNYDYVPSTQRVPMAAGLRRVTDIDYLRASSKNYAIYAGFGTFPAKDEKTIELAIPDDTSRIRFDRAILRVETRRGAPAPEIDVELNEISLAPLAREETELFTPLAQNDAYPVRDAVRFFTVPLNRITPGRNVIRLANRQRATRSCEFVAMELGLYR